MGGGVGDEAPSHPAPPDCKPPKNNGEVRWFGGGAPSSPRRGDPLQPINPLINRWERQSELTAPQVNKRKGGGSDRKQLEIKYLKVAHNER